MTPDLYRAALDRDRPEGALDVALAAWRATRHPAVAGAVRAASRRALERFAAPPDPLPLYTEGVVASYAAFHAGWMAVAARDGTAVATGWLARRLTHGIPWYDGGDAGRGHLASHPVHQRLVALSSRGPDPRIGVMVLRLAREPRLRQWVWEVGDGLYTTFTDALIAAGDPDAFEEVREMARRPRPFRQPLPAWLAATVLPGVLPEIEASALPDDVAAAWVAVGESPAALDGAESHFAAVFADPEDDAARAVLADVLQQAGDPRGELISLQLAGGAAAKGRIEEILREHRDDLLGPDLSRVLSNVVFRRGFPEEAILRREGLALAEVWERAIRDPRLGTLRFLGHAGGIHGRYGDFLASPAMRGLRRAEIRNIAAARALAAGSPLPVEELLVSCSADGALLRMLAAPAFHRLRHLVLAGRYAHVDVPSLVDSGLGKRLEVLELQTDNFGWCHSPHFEWPGPLPQETRVRDLADRLDELPLLRHAIFRGGTRRVDLIRRPGGWVLEHRRPPTDAARFADLLLPDDLLEVVTFDVEPADHDA